LSNVTLLGAERVRRLRTAKTREQLDTLLQEMGGELGAALAGSPLLPLADEYAIAFALALRTAAAPRASAACFDSAARVALSARAFEEALVALERAEAVHPCPERRKQIVALRRVLLPPAPQERLEKTHARSRRKRT
jgi:hypothetical protein